MATKKTYVVRALNRYTETEKEMTIRAVSAKQAMFFFCDEQRVPFYKHKYVFRNWYVKECSKYEQLSLFDLEEVG